MIFQPAIIAMLLASVATSVVVAVAAGFGLQVVRRWDIASGSELQLAMERRTYLISTLVGFAFVIELASLLLFVFNADRMAGQFVGAMCAVGTLNANAYGFPTILLKIANFFLAGTWLVMNQVDNKGYDYPLIRPKYRLLLLIAPLLLIEAAVQALYFLNLEADVITSCCGSIFSAGAASVTSDLASLPPGPAMVAFYALFAATLLAGLGVARWRRGGIAFAGLAGLAFAAAIVSVVSFISLYVYEHPHHHCPFCLLQAEYGYIGYWMYLPLFAGTTLALGLGSVMRFRGTASLAAVIPGVAQRYALLAVVLFALFLAVASVAILRSNLLLIG